MYDNRAPPFYVLVVGVFYAVILNSAENYSFNIKEIYDVMFPGALFDVPYLTETYQGTRYSVANPKTHTFIGHFFEPPSPGYYNHGQFDAMVETGDVLAVFSGHDHLNTYEVEYKGVKIINSPGVSFNAYGNEFVRGSRLITVNEDNPADFTSKVITVNDLAKENGDFANEIGISRFEAAAWVALGDFHLLLKMLSKGASWLIY